ncbi:hypothetical protein [Spirosoma aerophilum]
MEKDIRLNQLLTDYKQWLTNLTASVRLLDDDLIQLGRLKQQNPDMELLFDFLIECSTARQAFMSGLHQMILKRVDSLALAHDLALLAMLWGAHSSLRQVIESNQLALDEIRSHYVILLTNRKPVDTPYDAQLVGRQYLN